MELITQIENDIKEAMKAREKDRLDAVRYIKSLLIENRVAKVPKPEMDVVIAHAKKLKDSLVNFPDGHEIRVKTEREIAIVETYLPKALDSQAVEAIIKEIVSKLETPNLGLIMKELTPQIKGRFDGKEATNLVNKILTSK